ITRQQWDLADPIVAEPYSIEIASRDRDDAAQPLTVPRLDKIDLQSGPDLPADAHFASKLFQSRTVTIAALRSTGLPIIECDYLAIGGGLGSFAWVDHLRVFGVPAEAIRVVGINARCYQNWSRYCNNSQIPPHERIRSNGVSAPDNVWGFPGYATREVWRSLARGNIVGFGPLLQVFLEPALADTYTPKLADVTASLDREMMRIGWHNMLIQARAEALRWTADGRYVLAFRREESGAAGERNGFAVARFVHICTGYPATNFTGDLRAFKADERNASVHHAVVNAYEPHEQVYREIESKGRSETVIVRGRGIVASRVLQRLYEARQKNPLLRVIHQMRSRIVKGSKYGWARRPVFSHVDLQPFNWPKACWGGSLRKKIENAGPEQRPHALKALGGTSTASRRDWKALIRDGIRNGWYKPMFGTIEGMNAGGSPADPKVIVRFKWDNGQQETIEADFLIDCTGLIAEITASPFLADLVSTYSLARNKAAGASSELRQAGLSVTPNFEITGLANGLGHAYAAGSITQNGPYAPVDSLLGLQYAALRSIEHLVSLHAPSLHRPGPLRSFSQWLKWCNKVSP
ncbi:MAG TPA: hypothetical protein VE986_07145, partial [Hyphomicrobiales bacterium]|nr:hypothetical protein [Hyphomicrobiales bacterium]